MKGRDAKRTARRLLTGLFGAAACFAASAPAFTEENTNAPNAAAHPAPVGGIYDNNGIGAAWIFTRAGGVL